VSRTFHTISDEVGMQVRPGFVGYNIKIPTSDEVGMSEDCGSCRLIARSIRVTLRQVINTSLQSGVSWPAEARATPN
jgi:hypothetical protein